MPIKISTKMLHRLLDTMPADQNIMLVGSHGIGKSEILTKYYQDKGMKVVALFLGQMSDPGDLIGLPNKDEKTGKTEFMPPYWFPTDDQPIVLFLDELNRARPEVLQTIMDLALNRKLAGKKLPEGSVVISAVNDGEAYQLTDLDPALVSRFNIYNFAPTTSEWLLWAEQKQLDARVIDFIRNNDEWLDGNGNDEKQYEGLEKSPDRRAWKKVSDLIGGVEDLDDDYKNFIAGIIGLRATAAFWMAMKEMRQLSGKDVLLDFKKVEKELKKLRLHQLAIINEDIFRFIEVGDYPAKDTATICKNLNAYISMLEKQKLNESLAHFVSMITDGNYPKTTTFILTKTPKAYQIITKFIQNI